ncbi:MAG: TolC family protein [Gemmatimonadota bacterium]
MTLRLMVFLMLAPLTALAAQDAAPKRGASVALSLSDALARADSASESVGIARAGVRGAEAARLRARSALLPQLNGSATYSRTIKSQFAGFADASSSDTFPAPVNCGHFTPNPNLPLGERLDSLERGLDCAANGSGIDFGSLPFGRANTYNFGLSASQALFNPALRGQVAAAAATRDAAEAGLTAERARAVLDVAQAYLDAQLADRLLEIADSTLAQAERAFGQTRLEKNVGNVAEFDLLRATVTRDNQRPVVIQRRAARDRAFLKLRQLLDLPDGATLVLTTPLGDTTGLAMPGSVAPGGADTSIALRAPVRQAEAGLRSSEAQVRSAQGSRLPSLALSSTYAKIAFPERVFGINDFVTDWSVVLRLDVPLYTGGRLRADALSARAARDAAALRLRQAREQAEREAADVRSDLTAAEASYAASSGTADLAVRAYSIADVRYRNGLSTLTELSDARIQLEQAQANRAQAARDLQLARVHASLLRDLPFGAGGLTAAGGF